MTVISLLGGVRATVFLSLAVVSIVWGGVQTGRLSHCRAMIDKSEVALQTAAKEHAEWIVEKERAASDALAEQTRRHLEEEASAKAAYNKSIDDIRRGTLVLRDRFVCPIPATQSSGPTGSSDGGEARGLQTEDAEFLVSEAERADETARALKLAQDTIKIYQELLNGKER